MGIVKSIPIWLPFLIGKLVTYSRRVCSSHSIVTPESYRKRNEIGEDRGNMAGRSRGWHGGTSLFVGLVNLRRV